VATATKENNVKTRFDELKAKNLTAYQKARGRRTLYFLVRAFVTAWAFAILVALLLVIIIGMGGMP